MKDYNTEYNLTQCVRILQTLRNVANPKKKNDYLVVPFIIGLKHVFKYLINNNGA